MRPSGGVGTGGHHGSESRQSLPIFPPNSMLATVHPRAGPASSRGPFVTGGHRTVSPLPPIVAREAASECRRGDRPTLRVVAARRFTGRWAILLGVTVVALATAACSSSPSNSASSTTTSTASHSATSPTSGHSTATTGAVTTTTGTLLPQTASVTEFYSPTKNISCEIDSANGPAGVNQALCLTLSPAQSATLTASGTLTKCSGQTCLSNAGENTPTLKLRDLHHPRLDHLPLADDGHEVHAQQRGWVRHRLLRDHADRQRDGDDVDHRLKADIQEGRTSLIRMRSRNG